MDGARPESLTPARGNSAASSALPERFGRYELLGELGRGGMGVVWRARDVDLDRIVALKMIQRDRLGSPEALQRFVAEARLAARVRQAGVVGVYEVGSAHGQLYMAMELVAGGSLADRLRQGPLPEREAVRLVAQIARSLALLHTQGIVHRDLKPSNILIDGDGSPRISDFGLAVLEDANASVQATSGIVGTPGYMAPEQAAGRRSAIGPRTDVYGLGAVLYELLTAQRPIAGEEPISVILRVLHAAPPAPRRWRAELSREVESVCLKCLEKDPERRYASAADLADDLERLLAGEPPAAMAWDARTRLARWARREPALASHLLVLGAFYAMQLTNRYLFEAVDAHFHRVSTSIVAGCALSAVVFQAWLRRGGSAALVRALWVGADVALLTALLATAAKGAASTLTIAYLLVVGACGVWFDLRLVRTTTALCAAAYALLLVDAAWRRPETAVPVDHALLLFVALLAQGLLVGHLVARFRALNRYYQARGDS